MKPVDILLSTYNGGDFLPRLLDSLLAQSYQAFTLVVRDDGSCDHTQSTLERVAARHPEKVRLIPSTERLGVVKSYSQLLEASNAPYVMFCDQDDIWLPGKIAQSLAVMRRQEHHHGPDIPFLIHTNLAVVDKSEKILHSSFWRYSCLDPWKGASLPRLLTQNVVTGCTILMNRSLVDQVGPIPEKCVMHDHWVALVAAALGQIVALPNPTILYRQHGRNDTGALSYSVGRLLAAVCHKGFRTRLEANARGRHHQAAILLHRYSPQLTEKQTATIKAYLRFRTSSLIQRFKLMYEYDFRRTGLTRNLKELLA